MPAKGTKSTKTTKPKVTRSNVAKSSSKTGLLSKKIKFNWKIAAVIGVILVAALGYLFVRLSQAGNVVAQTSAGAMSESQGAVKGEKNGQPIISGPGFADKYYWPGNAGYAGTAQVYEYRVTFTDNDGDGKVLDNSGGASVVAYACGKELVASRISPATSMSSPYTMAVRLSSKTIIDKCGRSAEMQISVGIPRGAYISGITVVNESVAGTSTPVPAPNPANKNAAPAPQAGICEGQNAFGPGSQGGCVRIIQQRLTDLGYQPGTVDGIYGQNTANAVKVFQQRSGLPQDGVVGVQTWNALTSPNAARKQ